MMGECVGSMLYDLRGSFYVEPKGMILEPVVLYLLCS